MDIADSYFIVAAIIVAGVSVFFFRGSVKLKAIARVDERITKENDNALIMKRLIYHGGFPPIPKPTRLNLGLSKDAIILYSDDGNDGKVFFEDFKKIEKFSTLRKREKQRSMFFWAPIALMFVKEKTQHFVAIKYTDGDRDINHIVLEARDYDELNRLYQFVDNAWDGFKKCRAI